MYMYVLKKLGRGGRGGVGSGEDQGSGGNREGSLDLLTCISSHEEHNY